ncbi:hypothetical protein SAMN05216316_2732 [Nitrosovibrio sp. Nv6]|nr:hypothetical protein SAMN05216316_2732 [Nitrosovibrio sp. Nv6]
MKKVIVQPSSLLRTAFPYDQYSPREELIVQPAPFEALSPFELVPPLENRAVPSPSPIVSEPPFDQAQPGEEMVVQQASVPATEPSFEVVPAPHAVIGRFPPSLATPPPLELFPPLEKITRPTVPTSTAAYYLNRKPQTLRVWACLENGPLRPVRINGRLAWSVSAIRALVNGKAN